LSKQTGDEEEEPEDTRANHSCSVDPEFYDMIDDNIISVLVDACKPLFALVTSPSSSPNSKPSNMKHADRILATAKLIIAAGYKVCG
jgi:hypothetical protein